MLICSFVHFYFYVNIYSLLSSLHRCLKHQKKIVSFAILGMRDSTKTSPPYFRFQLGYPECDGIVVVEVEVEIAGPY